MLPKNWLLHLLGTISALATMSVSGQTVYVNFGETAIADTGWNTMAIGSLNTPISLIDSTGGSTSATMTKTAEFVWFNSAGYLGGDIGDFVANAVKDSLYAQTNTSPSPQIVFGGLDSSLTYDFTLFAHRNSSSNDRSGLYELSGANTGSVTINGNGSNTTADTVMGIIPDTMGQITLDISGGLSNDSGFYYLNALSFTVSGSAVPEPGSLSMIIGLLGLGWVWIFHKRNIRVR